MIGLGEGAASAIVVAGTVLLTFGIVAAVRVSERQLKVHAVSLGAVGPLLVLVSAPLWAEGRMLFAALLLSALLLVSAAVSAHAVMRLVALERPEDRGLKGPKDSPGRPGDGSDPGAAGGNDRS